MAGLARSIADKAKPSLMVAIGAKPKGEDGEGGEYDRESAVECCKEILDAIEAKDPERLCDALNDCWSIMDIDE